MHLYGHIDLGSSMTLDIYDGASTNDSLLLLHFNREVDSTIEVYASQGPLMIAFSSSYYYTARTGFDFIAECAYPACDEPRHLEAANLSDHEELITWNHQYGASEFELAYQAADLPPDSGRTMVWNSTSKLLTGLRSHTTYTARVRTRCGNNEYSEWATVTFTTDCEYTRSFPYEEGFETMTPGEPPACWTVVDDNAEIALSQTHSGGKSLQLRDTRFFSFAFMPRVDVTAVNMDNIDLHFWAKFSDNEGQYLVAGVMDDPLDTSTFVPVDTVHLTQNWQHFLVAFNNYSGTGSYIAFKKMKSRWYDSGYNLYIDDISLISHQCVVPLAIHSYEMVNVEDIHISWTHDDTSMLNYEVVYGDSGFDPDQATPIIVTDTTMTLPTLDPSHSYEVYVRSNCSTGQPSNWCGPYALPHVGQHWMHPGTHSITTCSGHIFDQAGPGSYYPNSTFDTLIIYPASPNSNIAISGVIEGIKSGDSLIFYEGAGTTGRELARYCRYDTQVAPLESAAGAMTVVFISDPYPNSRHGYNLTVTCVDRGSCPKPSAPVVTRVYDHDALLSWRNYGENQPQSYSFIYGLADTFDTADATTYQQIDNIADTCYHLTGLAESTSYACAVRANCDATTHRAWTVTTGFDTRCAAITTLPYVEDFENGMPCWTMGSDDSLFLPRVYENWGLNHSNVLWLHRWENCKSHVVMPLFDMPMRSLKLSFWYASWSSYTLMMVVGLLTNPYDFSTFEPIDTLYDNTSQFQQYNYSFGDYTGEARYIAFLAPAWVEDYDIGDPLLDNVTVEVDSAHLCFTAQALSSDTTLGVADVSVGTKMVDSYPKGTQLVFTATPLEQQDDQVVARFVQWNDGNVDTPRTLILEQDTVLTAIFARDTLEGIATVDGMSLRIYPNPAHTQVTIECDQEALEVVVYDLSGRVVLKSETRTASAVTLGVEALPAGIYLTRITTAKGVATQKLIIK